MKHKKQNYDDADGLAMLKRPQKGRLLGKDQPRTWEIHKESIPYSGVKRNEMFFSRLNI